MSYSKNALVFSSTMAVAVFLLALPTGATEVSGNVTFTPSGYSVARVGEFSISWHTDQMLHVRVSRADDQERTVWESVAGEPFVWTRLVETEFKENSGSFTVNETEKKLCYKQTVDRILASGDGIIFEGELVSDGWFWNRPTRLEYSFSLTPSESPDQLAFAVTVYPVSEYGNGNQVWRAGLVAASSPDERIYGFGEQFTHFNLKGKKLPILVREQGHGRGLQPLSWVLNTFGGGAAGYWHTSYAPVPHYLTSHSKSLFLENYEYSVFDMTEADRISIEVDAEQMRGRILSGSTPLENIEQYTEFTGRMQGLPDWVGEGAIVGLQGGSEPVREHLQLLLDHDVPVAAVWMQDWVGQRSTPYAQRLWWNWEIDTVTYPDFELLQAELRDQGIRSLGYVNPFLTDASLKVELGHNYYDEAAQKGYLLVGKASGEPLLIDSAGFDAAMVDLSNPEARTWLKNVIKTQLIDNGFSGWMADFGEALPYESAPFSQESPRTYHHRYAEDWARLNGELIEEMNLTDEILFFSRAGYTRTPGLSQLFWAGDQLVSWDEHDGIKTALTALLSSGISGYSLNHSDIGGCINISKEPLVNYERSKELLVRWMEMNAFTAVFRNHEGNNPLTSGQQIYTDTDTIEFFARFAKIYQALAPYRRVLMEEARERGFPVVRHPLLHYPDDETVLDLEYQFMLGTDFMIAPVLDENSDRVDVYLPRGKWVHLWTGRTYGDEDSGVWLEEILAPLGYPAVFYKADSPVGAQFALDLVERDILVQQDQLADHGLYWYGYENERQKFEPGVPNRFYDPDKPVVILGHGQKPNSAVTRDVIFFRCAREICGEGEVSYVHHDWLDAGYNVGVFDWTVFADEKEVLDAEAKLWSPDGPRGMRYRLPSGSYATQGAPPTGLIQEMAVLYEEALRDNTSQEIRLVGYSLGAQLVTGIAHAVHRDIHSGLVSGKMMPGRIALLDPIWTKGSKDYLSDENGDGSPDWTGERTRHAIRELVNHWQPTNRFAVELYFATQLDMGIVGDKNEDLRHDVAGSVRLFLDYIGLTSVEKKHMAIKTYYFLSFAAPMLREVDGRGNETGRFVPSAAAGNEQLIVHQQSGAEWNQSGGKTTVGIEDDTFIHR